MLRVTEDFATEPIRSMILPLLEIPLRPRQRHHGGGCDGVGLLVLNMDGEWIGHRLDAGTDDTPVICARSTATASAHCYARSSPRSMTPAG